MMAEPRADGSMDIELDTEPKPSFERDTTRELRRLAAGMQLCIGYLRTMLRREMTLAVAERLEREYEVKMREIERDE